MRLSGVKQAIIEAIEAITPDDSAGPRDTFTHIDTGGRDLERAPDRVFRVALSMVPRRGDLITLDAYVGAFDLSVFYTPTPSIEDRIAKDAEKIVDALLPLHQQNTSIYRIDIEPGTVAELDQFIAARFDLTVIYRLTGV